MTRAGMSQRQRKSAQNHNVFDPLVDTFCGMARSEEEIGGIVPGLEVSESEEMFEICEMCTEGENAFENDYFDIIDIAGSVPEPSLRAAAGSPPELSLRATAGAAAPGGSLLEPSAAGIADRRSNSTRQAADHGSRPRLLPESTSAGTLPQLSGSRSRSLPESASAGSLPELPQHIADHLPGPLRASPGADLLSGIPGPDDDDDDDDNGPNSSDDSYDR